jgi:DNA-binding GntR family transcriptional regulator
MTVNQADKKMKQNGKAATMQALRRGQRVSVEPRIARHDVRDEIQRRILSGERKAGDRLSQQSLAKELGVAQGTVRESLLELQWLGLVDSIDRLGVFVEKLDASRICEAYEVREVLEGLASRLACDHVGRADLADLRAMAGDVLRFSKKNDVQSMGSTDHAFHLRIIGLSRNKILIRLAETYRILGMAVWAARDPKIVHAEHLRIVDAIESNSADEAERLARQHVRDARRAIEKQAEEGTFLPNWV